MQNSKNIIIGAGISGLSCGYALRDCIVVEEKPFIGGLSATMEHGEYRFDLGGHRFFTQNPEIDSFFTALLKDEILTVERKSKIYRRGKFLHYPLRISVVFKLSPFDITLSLLTYLYRKINPLQESSFERKTINNFGDHLYKLFFRDYTQKVWGLSCKEISPELTDARLQKISLLRVIKHALLKDNAIKSFTDTFLYPQKGIGVLPRALSSGLKIDCNSKVTEIICSPDRIKKVIVNNSQELSCQNLISTMPLTELVTLLNPPAEVKTAASNLKFRSLICVFLVLSKEFFSDNHWIYFPEAQVFGRLHEPKNWSHCMAPQMTTGICLEIFCNKEDGIWNKADAVIVDQVANDLSLIQKQEIKDYRVVKIEYAYPIYDINYRHNVGVVKNYTSAFKNLFLLGRTGAFEYINIDSCIDNGLKLGNSLRNTFASNIYCAE